MILHAEGLCRQVTRREKPAVFCRIAWKISKHLKLSTERELLGFIVVLKHPLTNLSKKSTPTPKKMICFWRGVEIFQSQMRDVKLEKIFLL